LAASEEHFPFSVAEKQDLARGSAWWSRQPGTPPDLAVHQGLQPFLLLSFVLLPSLSAWLARAVSHARQTWPGSPCSPCRWGACIRSRRCLMRMNSRCTAVQCLWRQEVTPTQDLAADGVFENCQRASESDRRVSWQKTRPSRSLGIVILREEEVPQAQLSRFPLEVFEDGRDGTPSLDRVLRDLGVELSGVSIC
jgi:hypothetical protein